MKANLLKLGYSVGAPPIFVSIFLCYFLEVGPVPTTMYAIGLVVLVLLPVRFPITSLVTTHWQPGWQSITNYMLFLFAIPIMLWLKQAPKVIYWLLLANILIQLAIFPILLKTGIIKPGFNRRF
jgi:hypothetical protein